MARHAIRKRKFLVNFVNNENNKGVRGNPDHFIFFDTETKQTDEIKKIGKKEYRTIVNTLDIGWAVYWNRLTNDTEWIYFESIKEFHKFVSKKLTDTGKNVVWIVAHNIVFDNFIVDIWDFFKNKNYEDCFIHTKGMTYIQKLGKYSYRISNKTGDIKRTTDKTVMLVNNGNIFPEKLENIGETVGFPKLKVDFATCIKEELKVYCKRDVEILLEFWKQWTTFLSTNKLGNIKYTISSQSMEAYKKRFCKSYIVLDNDMDNIAFERKAYFGGRTEIFYKGVVKTPVYYFDVNSMYPHVMKEYRYPVEHKFVKINPSIEQVQYYIESGWMVIAECYMDTQNRAYPCKMENTLLFPVGKFVTYLATPEVVEALNNNDIVKFGKVSLYSGSVIFSDYIDFFYNFRLELKAAGNKQEKMVKLFLNSLYGKFGQMFDKWVKTTIKEIKDFDPDFNLDEWIMDEYKIPKILIDGVDMTPKIRYVGGELQMAGEKEESEISFPAIAAHVTSYSRMIIWEAIKYCKLHNIKYYYCDTDSIFTSEPLPADIVDPNKLGKFKLEKMYDNGVEFINLKNYCPLNEQGLKVAENENKEIVIINDEAFTNESKVLKGKEWKMKGVSAGAVMIDENTFIQQEWGGLPKQEYYKKFGRQPGEFWVIYKEKKNHGKIKKGNLSWNGDIHPFELNEWEEENKCT